jgi:hypothetical protein
MANQALFTSVREFFAGYRSYWGGESRLIRKPVNREFLCILLNVKIIQCFQKTREMSSVRNKCIKPLDHVLQDSLHCNTADSNFSIHFQLLHASWDVLIHIYLRKSHKSQGILDIRIWVATIASKCSSL